MDGSATLTIVASSTTMNCATQTITRTSQRFESGLVLILLSNASLGPVFVACNRRVKGSFGHVDFVRQARNGTWAVMPRFLPIGKEAKGAAGFLLAALPALGALLTALAISGDLIGRMARNHPVASFGAFGSAALAVFLGAIAAYGLEEGSRQERSVISVGILVLGAALVFGVYAGVATWGDRAQPSITVTPKSGSLVAVSVHGIGLRSSDHLVVEVEQLLRGSDQRGQPTWQPGQALYGAS